MTVAMAPVEKPPQDKLEKDLKDIVQNLYELMVQAANYDNVGPGVQSRDVLIRTITHLHTSLQTLSASAKATQPEILIPPELLTYVDGGRNPDIYTREFVELAKRGNQLMKGKQEAFGSFRDVLAREMGLGLPELREDVRAVVSETGGRTEDLKWEEEGARRGDDVKMEGTGH